MMVEFSWLNVALIEPFHLDDWIKIWLFHSVEGRPVCTLTLGSLASYSNCIRTDTKVVRVDFHFFKRIIVSIIFPTWFFDVGQKASGSLLQLVRFPCLGPRFCKKIRDGHKNRWIISFGVFRGSSSHWKMVSTNESPISARGRTEYVTSCLRHLPPTYFGEFRVSWPLMIRKIYHMGSNLSEIRMSFVIIAKSYYTICVIWHNKFFSQFSLCI